MRILLALGADASEGAAAVAALASEHEVILTHDADLAASHALELELRNRLPDKDVVSVLPQVVVDPEAPGSRGRSPRSAASASCSKPAPS